jgi:uncharacterized Zn finger protein
MPVLRDLIVRMVPTTWADSMERESRRWKLSCPCGFEASVWELGGIRWKASGKKRVLLRCRSCGKISRQKMRYDDAST